MSDILKAGEWVYSQDKKYRIIDEIGSGGQGMVYRATDDLEEIAIKWYNTTASTPGQYEAISRLIEAGQPGDDFVWPMEIVEGTSKSNFGYVMPLIDSKRFIKLSHYFGDFDQYPGISKVIDVAMRLSYAFYELHSNGWCYKDISFGNIFVDFANPSILICDNDNVVYDNIQDVGENWGTTGFMAPEVLRGEAPPSTQTDLFSLAVVLFRLLHMQHPLQGRLEYETLIADYESDLKLYGTNPIFIYDPVDETNRPVPGKKDIADQFWHKYPEFIKDLFTTAFTEGLHRPEMRVRESIWIKALSKMQNRVFYCSNCEKELFYERDKLKKGMKCISCHKVIDRLPPRLKINDEIILLNHDTVLNLSQIDSDQIMAFDKTVGRVEIHPTKPGNWGIRNLSDLEWQYEVTEDDVRGVPPGKIAPLINDATINFGGQKGRIRLGSKIKSGGLL